MRAPWNASWTAEDRYEARPCKYAGGRVALWQPFKPGEGRPLFAKPHAVRQRRSIVEQRCTVCGETTEHGKRVFYPLGSWVVERGVLLWMTTEAPVHAFCAELARRVCPRLRELDAEALPFPETAMVCASLIGGPAVEADFGLKIDVSRPIVGHLKLAFTVAQAVNFVPLPDDPSAVEKSLLSPC